MKIFLKQNWFKLSILAIIVLIITGYIIFFVIGQSLTKEYCYKMAYELTNPMNPKLESSREEFNFRYQQCLKSSGL